MNVRDPERAARLHILNSLARSQRALSMMLESMAGICAGSEETAKRMTEHMDVIGKYQRILAAKLSGFRIRSKRRGRPGKVWLCADLLPLVSKKRKAAPMTEKGDARNEKSVESEGQA